MSDTKKTGVEIIADDLKYIKEKIDSSRALNGGFNELMSKVDKVEDQQQKINSSVQDLKAAIYNPDDGLFSRIKDLVNDQEDDRMRVKYCSLQHKAWETEHLKKHDKLDTQNEQSTKQIIEALETVRDISKWQKKISSAGVWLMASLATIMLGLVVKVVYTMVTGKTDFP